MTWPRRRSKYGNKKTEVDNVTFDSKAEAQRYRELKLMAAAGVIRDIELQPRFEFVVGDPAQRIGSYRGDFRYFDVAKGAVIVEDVKSPSSRTEAYMLRLRLMRACHGVEVQEWPPRKRKARRSGKLVSR